MAARKKTNPPERMLHAHFWRIGFTLPRIGALAD